MTWFREEDVPDDVFEREKGNMEEERDDINDQINNSRSLREQKAYKDLLTYLEQREETFNVFFDEPLTGTFRAFVKSKLRLSLVDLQRG